jgi:putative flippase GtrA
MKIIRYFFVGCVAASVDLVSFIFAVKFLIIDWMYAAPFSFLLGTITNYFLSINFVFTSGIRFKKSLEVFLVFLVSAIGLSINQLILWYLIEFVDFEMINSKIIAIFCVFFWNYSFRRFFIFK